MFQHLKMILVSAVIGTSSFSASAQLISDPPTLAPISAVVPTQFVTNARIVQLWTRPEGFYILLDRPIPALSCMSNVTGDGRFTAFIAWNQHNEKTYRETAQFAFAANRFVRVYVNRCYLISPTDSDIQYPIVLGFDALPTTLSF
jgi:hypothetical protein